MISPFLHHEQIEIVNHLTAMLTPMSTVKKTANLTNALTWNLTAILKDEATAKCKANWTSMCIC